MEFHEFQFKKEITIDYDKYDGGVQTISYKDGQRLFAFVEGERKEDNLVLFDIVNEDKTMATTLYSDEVVKITDIKIHSKRFFQKKIELGIKG